jgi:hypothetical protein
VSILTDKKDRIRTDWRSIRVTVLFWLAEKSFYLLLFGRLYCIPDAQGTLLGREDMFHFIGDLTCGVAGVYSEAVLVA